MSRTSLGALAAVAAAVTVAAGPAATTAQADPSDRFPILIADSTLDTYATAGPSDGSVDDRHVRMLPAAGVPAQQWDFLDSAAGGTAIVSRDTGGCLQLDLASPDRHVRVGGCLRDANESWTVEWGELGATFVHHQTGDCLTDPAGSGDDTGLGRRLVLRECDGGTGQIFSVVW
ncbi:RICIN domain-containing protein [Streptomyces sp. 4N509B]|uniref:RICIN domain-containing protein n=1 Tax=Streptomyces sp. 4N509B TaxID=3457413 RepID=UPI003FD1A53B